MPNTRGCHIASIIKNPINANKYLCAVVGKSILVMEWFNPRSTFVEVNRVSYTYRFYMYIYLDIIMQHKA